MDVCRSGYEPKKRVTRREKFLGRMERLIPWEQIEALIRPVYPKAGRGRLLYPLSMVLRIHYVQLFYNLSDPGMEDLFYEVELAERSGVTARSRSQRDVFGRGEPVPNSRGREHFNV